MQKSCSKTGNSDQIYDNTNRMDHRTEGNRCEISENRDLNKESIEGMTRVTGVDLQNIGPYKNHQHE